MDCSSQWPQHNHVSEYLQVRKATGDLKTLTLKRKIYVHDCLAGTCYVTRRRKYSTCWSLIALLARTVANFWPDLDGIPLNSLRAAICPVHQIALLWTCLDEFIRQGITSLANTSKLYRLSTFQFSFLFQDWGWPDFQWEKSHSYNLFLSLSRSCFLHHWVDPVLYQCPRPTQELRCAADSPHATAMSN